MDNSNGTNVRNGLLDCYKGILIILVVVRHVLQYAVADEGGILTNFIWAIQMPGFMLISGYFSFHTVRNSKDIYYNLKKNIEHYFIPFLLWFICVDVLLLGKYNRNVLKGIKVLFLKVDVGLWFLWTIFILACLAVGVNYIIYKNCSKKWSTIVCVFAFCLCISIGLVFVSVKARSTNAFGIKYILYYSIFYGTGLLIRIFEDGVKKCWKKWGNTIYFISIIFFCAIIFNYDLYKSNETLIAISFRLIAGFFGNIVLFNLIIKYKNLLYKMKMNFIGVYTLEIYTSHMYVNNIMKFDNTYGLFSVLGFSNFVISFMLTIIFTYIIIACLKVNPMTDFIFYGKRKKNKAN